MNQQPTSRKGRERNAFSWKLPQKGGEGRERERSSRHENCIAHETARTGEGIKRARLAYAACVVSAFQPQYTAPVYVHVRTYKGRVTFSRFDPDSELDRQTGHRSGRLSVSELSANKKVLSHSFSLPYPTLPTYCQPLGLSLIHI